MLKRYTKNDCVMLPYAAITCRYDHCCHICDVADRVRKNSRIHTRDINELFDYYDVLPKTAKGGGSEYLYRTEVTKLPQYLPKSLDIFQALPYPFQRI